MKNVDAKNKLIRNSFYLVLALFICVLGLVTYFFVACELIHSKNSSKNQTYYLQEMFNADGLYRQDNGGRLQHNNGKPIYVTIQQGAFDEYHKETIVSALNNIFNLVGEINDNYHYEIVEEDGEINYKNKSRISFEVSEVAGANAMARRKPSMYSFGSKGAFNNVNTIVYDSDFLTQNKDRFYYTTLHELLHVFGLEDVYGVKQQTHLDTYLNVYTDERLKMITPNDYKMLVACYAQNLSKIAKEDQNAYLNSLHAKIDEYSKKYYEYYCQVKRDTEVQIWSTVNTFAASEPDEVENKETISFGVFLTHGGERVEATLSEGRYTLTVYDKQDKIIDSCEGKAYDIDGEIFLQGVHFESFKQGREIYTDMHIFTYLQKYSLYDLFDNFYSNSGKVC